MTKGFFWGQYFKGVVVFIFPVAELVMVIIVVVVVVVVYPRNRPWRHVGLSHVKDPTLSRQSAHRWR
jgi:hypothetical protein